MFVAIDDGSMTRIVNLDHVIGISVSDKESRIFLSDGDSTQLTPVALQQLLTGIEEQRNLKARDREEITLAVARLSEISIELKTLEGIRVRP